jgi:hypothetical protein
VSWNRFANCEVDNTQEPNFILARVTEQRHPMQTKPRTHNTARDLERWLEKPMSWPAIAVLLICTSYFIVDIVRMLWTPPGY